MKETGAQKAERGVNPVVLLYKVHLANLFLFDKISKNTLELNMPVVDNMSIRSVFKVLLLVDLYPYRHKKYYYTHCHISTHTVSKSLEYLESKCLVKTSPHARKVHKLDVWTFDTTYVVTREGREVIRRVLEVSGILSEK